MSLSDSNSPDRSANVARGRMFEKLAAKYLVENGFEILESNWQAGHKEIDIIVQKDGFL